MALQAERDVFDRTFYALMGVPPFGWQRRLYEEHFVDFDPPKVELPRALDIPTGLGKTAVIVVWLLARLAGAASCYSEMSGDSRFSGVHSNGLHELLSSRDR